MQPLPGWATNHCFFGEHGEPFLWSGSGNDIVDTAIMQLINLAKENPRMAEEAAEFVAACVHDAAQHPLHSDAASAADKSADTAPDSDTIKPAGSQAAPVS